VSVLGALEDIVENCQVDDNLLTWNWFKSWCQAHASQWTELSHDFACSWRNSGDVWRHGFRRVLIV